MKHIVLIPLWLLAMMGACFCEDSNTYFKRLGEIKMFQDDLNVTVDSRINMTDIEYDIQKSYSAVEILSQACIKHRINCNDTVAELKIDLEEVESRLDNIYVILDSQRIKAAAEMDHDELNKVWLDNLTGNEEKCGEIIAEKVNVLHNNITTAYSRAEEITDALNDLLNDVLHPFIYSPMATIRILKQNQYKDQLLYRPVTLYNYHKIMRFVSFEMIPTPENYTIFVKMIIPVFQKTNNTLSLYELQQPFAREGFKYFVSASEHNVDKDFIYGMMEGLDDCIQIDENRDMIYACGNDIEYVQVQTSVDSCLLDAFKSGQLDWYCKVDVYFASKYFVCIALGLLLFLIPSILYMAVLMYKRRYQTNRYQHLVIN